MSGWGRCSIALLLVSLPSVLCGLSQTEDTLIGWKGDSFDKHAVFGIPNSAEATAQTVDDDERWVETVSWNPRAFVFHKFLTEQECNHIIHSAAPTMKRSTVVANNGSAVDQIRSSYGTFVSRLADPIITRIESKLANWTQLPVVNQEDIQVLRYELGQKYGAHYDSLERLCTVLVFLTDTDEGGETAFPKTDDGDWAESGQRDRYGPFSSCADGHVAVKPRKGTALLFYSIKPNGVDTDAMALHTGCPITKEWARKWTATFWIHAKAYRPRELGTKPFVSPVDDAGKCIDGHVKCSIWAEHGECTKNPMYMMGSGDQPGSCMAACKVCTTCADGDKACYKTNLDKLGYLDLREEVLELTGSPLLGMGY